MYELKKKLPQSKVKMALTAYEPDSSLVKMLRLLLNLISAGDGDTLLNHSVLHHVSEWKGDVDLDLLTKFSDYCLEDVTNRYKHDINNIIARQGKGATNSIFLIQYCRHLDINENIIERKYLGFYASTKLLYDGEMTSPNLFSEEQVNFSVAK